MYSKLALRQLETHTKRLNASCLHNSVIKLQTRQRRVLRLRFGTRDLGVVSSFASLYAALWFLPLFPVVGVPGKFFPLNSVIAPLIGLILGPYLGLMATSIGGFIGWSITQSGPLFFLSFVPSATASFCAGLLYLGEWKTIFLLYTALFSILAFYPSIGPGWLFPFFLWFQVLGLIVLVSPLRLKAFNSLHKRTTFFELSWAVAVVSFIATLFGHVVGGIIFQTMYFPAFYPEIDYWRSLWQGLTFLYPIERSIITLLATVIGAPLINALRTHGFKVGEE